MNKEYNEPAISPDWDDEEEEIESEIDWVGMLAKLLKHKKFIIIWTIVASVIGVCVALIQKHKYSVTVVLAPEVQMATKTGGLSGIASMLGVGKVSLGNSTDALNITLFPQICSSTPFLTQLFDVPVNLSEESRSDDETPASTTVYDFVLGKYKPKSAFSLWLEELLKKDDEKTVADTVNISHLTKSQSKAVEILQRMISADVDDKSGVTTISVTCSDSHVAQQLADTVCQHLQEFIINYRTKKAKDDLDYYTRLADESREKMIEVQAAYARTVDFDRSVILQSASSDKQRLQQEVALTQQIYAQLEQQKDAANAKYQELKPVFAVVQPGSIPEYPINSRKKTVIIFMFAGFVLSALWKVFVVDFIKGFKEKLRAATKEQEAEQE